jgi:hypothetical protein
MTGLEEGFRTGFGVHAAAGAYRFARKRLAGGAHEPVGPDHLRESRGVRGEALAEKRTDNNGVVGGQRRDAYVFPPAFQAEVRAQPCCKIRSTLVSAMRSRITGKLGKLNMESVGGNTCGYEGETSRKLRHVWHINYLECKT